MKKINTLLVTLSFALAAIIPNQSKAQQSCPWAKKAGGNNEEAGAAVATDASGNVYYLGNFFSQSIIIGTTTLHNQPYQAFNYGSEMFLAKYDSCGNFKWAKQAGGDADTYGTGLAVDAAGNVYVTGYFADTVLFGGTSIKLITSAYRDVFIAKYNTNGVTQWAKQGTGNDQDIAYSIAVDGSSNIYVAGGFASSTITFGTNSVSNATNDQFTNDLFIAKFDNNGTNLWVRGNTSNSNSTGEDAIAYGIGVDGTGNAYVTGKFSSNYIRFGIDSLPSNGNSDIFLVKYNTSGTEQWLRVAGGSNDDAAYALASDASGNVSITGYIGGGSALFGPHTISYNGQNRGVFLAKYDAAGANTWARAAIEDYYSDNIGNSVALDAAGNAFITGTYSSDSLKLGAVTLYNTSYLHGNGGDYFYDIFVAKYKSNGNLSWARTAGGDSVDIGNGVATGPNSALYLTGEFRSQTISLAGISLTLTAGSLAGEGDAFICNNIATDSIAPNICLVSADSINAINQYNVVYWDKTAYSTAANFIVYREVSTGVYKKIGSQPYSALSRFIDTTRSVGPANGDPNIGTYKYALQFVDTAGAYSLLSPYHNTVYFQNNSGTFNWNMYTVGNPTVTPVSNFNLMRDNLNNGVWTLVGTVTGSQTSLNDPNYATYQAVANWRVEADSFNCNPTYRIAGGNAVTAAIVKSKSNITNNRGIGIAQISNANLFNIYPNPSKGTFVIETSLTEKQNVQVLDINGKVVLSQVITGTTTIDASILSEGVYNINIKNNNMLVNKKMVIVK